MSPNQGARRVLGEPVVLDEERRLVAASPAAAAALGDSGPGMRGA